MFHADDLKLLNHKKDSTVASAIIAKLELICAIIDPMTVHRVKVYHYLGTTMDFRVQGEVHDNV